MSARDCMIVKIFFFISQVFSLREGGIVKKISKIFNRKSISRKDRILSLILCEGSHAVLKVLEVLDCEIGFQDLEKVLNLAKMCIKF